MYLLTCILVVIMNDGSQRVYSFVPMQIRSTYLRSFFFLLICYDGDYFVKRRLSVYMSLRRIYYNILFTFE